MFLYVPANLFPGSGSQYVTLFSRFGDHHSVVPGTGSDSSFEEWSYDKAGPRSLPSSIETVVHIGTGVNETSPITVPANGVIPFGSMVYDSAVLSTTTSGGPVYSGTVTYTLFNTSGTVATGDDSVVGSPHTVIVNGSVPESYTVGGADGPLGGGSYYYIATYSGDGTYAPATGVPEPFIVRTSTPPPPASVPVTLSGRKFNDHNANGVDNGLTEEGVANVRMFLDSNDNGLLEWLDSDADMAWDAGEGEQWVATNGNGDYGLTNLGPGTYRVRENMSLLPGTWVHSTANPDPITASSGVDVDGVNFGNARIGNQNGKTLGFWSNKNGQALITSGDLPALRNLNLKNATGGNFDPTTAAQVSTWLLNANASNMAYMLSSQLTATVLNVRRGNYGTSTAIFVGTGLGSGGLVDTARNTQGAAIINNLDGLSDTNGLDGTGYVNLFGFASIQGLIDAANAELSAAPLAVASGPHRTYQEALKNAFDAMNNNLAVFVL